MREDRTETREREDTMARRTLTGLIICGCLLWAAPVAADPITELNVIAAETIFSGGRPPGAAPLLDFAMVHAAIHDAVQAYEKRFQPYAIRIRHASGAPVAAAAAAARDVLMERFPLQTASIHSKYLLFLENHGLTEADAGRRVGETAANAISRGGQMMEAIRRRLPRPTSGAREPASGDQRRRHPRRFRHRGWAPSNRSRWISTSSFAPVVHRR